MFRGSKKTPSKEETRMNKKWTDETIEKVVNMWNGCNLTTKEFAEKYTEELKLPETFGKLLTIFRKKGWTVRYPRLMQSHLNSKDQIKEDLKQRKARLDLQETRKKYKKSLERIEELEERLDNYLQISQSVDKITFKTPIIKRHEVIPVIQLSDWHLESIIDPSTVNNMNDFSPDIGRQRVALLSEKIRSYLRTIKSSREINRIIIILGGDFIGGNLREEDLEKNAMTPLEAIMFAKEQLTALITSIAEEPYIKKVYIHCVYGNHARLIGITGTRPKISTGYKNNLEWLMYKTLKSDFVTNKKIELHVPNSGVTYFEINGQKVRVIHGEGITYRGGIGGLTIPLLKKIKSYDESVTAKLNYVHHFHHFSMPTKNIVCNGSLCGYDAYAQHIAASYEPPSQNVSLINDRGAISHVTRIMLD